MESRGWHRPVDVDFDIIKRQRLAASVRVFDADERHCKLSASLRDVRRYLNLERQVRIANVSDRLRSLSDDRVLEFPRSDALERDFERDLVPLTAVHGHLLLLRLPVRTADWQDALRELELVRRRQGRFAVMQVGDLLEAVRPFASSRLDSYLLSIVLDRKRLSLGRRAR